VQTRHQRRRRVLGGQLFPVELEMDQPGVKP
jgi:hypothetical protein